MLAGFLNYVWEHTWQLAACGVVFIVLQRLRAAVPGQKTLRKGVLVDLALSYGVVLVSLPFYSLIMWETGRLLQAHAQFAWLARFRDAVTAVGPVWQFVFATTLADFLSYWRHRWFHHGWLWRFHATHHAAEEVDWLTNERFHPIDYLAGQVLQAIPFLIIGFSPGVVAFHGVARRTYSMFLHSNVRVSYGPLDYVFVSPMLHRWHHSADARTIGKNYSVVFSAFDWMFGSWARPEGEMPVKYGLLGEQAPRTLGGLLLYAFRRPASEGTGAVAEPVARAEAATAP